MSEQAGTVSIATEVLATIVNLTAMAVPGVIAMAVVPRGRLLSRPQPDATRGVQVRVSENTVEADLYLVVEHGVDMVAVATRVQRDVGQAVHEMLGMAVRHINVYIQGIE